MKALVKCTGLMSRLGLTVAALLLGQQALAVGTDAGTEVSNQATVSYSVGTVIQTPIESDPLGNTTPGAGNPTVFVVDRRVSFTLVAADALPTDAIPGGPVVFNAYTLTNNSNAEMDWELTLADLGLGIDVNGFVDTGDLMTNYDIRVANGDGAAGVPDGTDLDFVDDLPEDASVVIHVLADAPLTLQNNDIDNFTLRAAAADHPDPLTTPSTPGVLDPVLVESGAGDDPAVVDNVMANPSAEAGTGEGVIEVDDGFRVVSADLEVTKEAAVISAPFGSDKAIPGAIIEYTITVENRSLTADALNVSIADAIDSDVELQLGVYGGAGQDISLDNGGAASTCSADPAVSDTDGCSFDIPNLVVGNATVPITVAANTTLIVQFQVLIPNL